MKIGCAILAGGKSSRMGTDKALLEYEGKQFIRQIAGELSWFDERIIARGSNSGFEDELEREWTVIPDLYPEHGPIGGLHAALSACESDALFVVTCDMPLIESELVRELCELMQREPKKQSDMVLDDRNSTNMEISDIGIMGETAFGEERVDAYDAVISVGEGGKIHPLCGVYRKSVLPVLEEQIVSDQNRVMAALKKLRVKYVTIDSPARARQLTNINTPEDYRKLKHLL